MHQFCHTLLLLLLFTKLFAQDTIVTTTPSPILITDSIIQDSILVAIDTLTKPDTISIAAVGDVMLGTSFPTTPNYLPPNDGRNLLDPVKDILNNATLAFGNLEGCFLNVGEPTKQCKDSTKCYVFRMPERYAPYLKEAGFDMLSLANNHAGDFGDPARKTTIRLLDSLGINHAGQTIKPYTTFEQGGLKYGFVAFSPNAYTLQITELEAADAIVRELDSLCDIVIVSFHGGAEGIEHQHVTMQTEIFYGEDRGNVYEFSHRMIDAGADMVFGHGPHLLRATELYRDRLICYSLGNFATYARFSLIPPKHLAPIVEVFTNSEGLFLYGKVHNFVQIGEGGPESDDKSQSYTQLKTLTESDFPQTNLQFPGNNLILRKP
jgi:poly-gamma-glutamate capsule biosynthesis protein CapA/YwtB (metallophosphatase superfamily)